MSNGLKWFAAGVVAFCAMIFGGGALLFMETIEPQQVGVFQYRPYLFGKNGIDQQVIMGPARAYMWPSTKLWKISLAPHTITAHAEDLMTKDRVPLDFDLAVTIRVTNPNEVPDLIQKFGTGPVPAFGTLVLQEGTEKKQAPTGELMSYLRDQVRHFHSAVFIAAQNEDGSSSDSAASVEQQTAKYINGFMKANSAGMVQVDNIALGRANPPEGVKRTIEATAQQAQEVKTQQERKRAADARALAEIAVAGADNAYLNAMNFTSEQFIQLEQLKVYREVCGKGGCIFVNGQAPIALTPSTTQRAEMIR